jgi:hypothetical protein
MPTTKNRIETDRKKALVNPANKYPLNCPVFA